MGFQSSKHKYVLELFQKIACSKSEIEYDELYEQLPWEHSSVIAYYNSNWHPIDTNGCNVTELQDLRWMRELQTGWNVETQSEECMLTLY